MLQAASMEKQLSGSWFLTQTPHGDFMKNVLMVLTSVVMLASCGRPASSDLASSNPGQVEGTSVVVVSHKVVGVNPGINPNARASKVSLVVQAGTNECMARGKEFVVARVQKAGVIHLVVKELTKNIEPEMCTMEYKPVYAVVSTVIRGVEGQTPKVVIDNYKSFNNSLQVKI